MADPRKLVPRSSRQKLHLKRIEKHAFAWNDDLVFTRERILRQRELAID